MHHGLRRTGSRGIMDTAVLFSCACLNIKFVPKGGVFYSSPLSTQHCHFRCSPLHREKVSEDRALCCLWMCVCPHEAGRCLKNTSHSHWEYPTEAYRIIAWRPITSICREVIERRVEGAGPFTSPRGLSGATPLGTP